MALSQGAKRGRILYWKLVASPFLLYWKLVASPFLLPSPFLLHDASENKNTNFWEIYLDAVTMSDDSQPAIGRPGRATGPGHDGTAV
jgi:hypothetical protein